ncbi:MAG: hypothetical protein C4533_00530 [Candidatus Omnitrophota bacterium]|jgi:hypothetical protein|nr:MAG: hypothetical protein C4533_00530 [Candidatus Omnitrophota bacterium]
MDKKDIRNLKKRYLIWFYKMAKEALDKVERKFTQLEVDGIVLRELKMLDKGRMVQTKIAEFEKYIDNKKKDGIGLKYNGKELRDEYLYLVLRLKAVEKTIVIELGKKALSEIKSLYEDEMTERIIKSTEH